MLILNHNYETNYSGSAMVCYSLRFDSSYYSYIFGLMLFIFKGLGRGAKTFLYYCR